jgi:hypothetical protein
MIFGWFIRGESPPITVGLVCRKSWLPGSGNAVVVTKFVPNLRVNPDELTCRVRLSGGLAKDPQPDGAV